MHEKTIWTIKISSIFLFQGLSKYRSLYKNRKIFMQSNILNFVEMLKYFIKFLNERYELLSLQLLLASLS